MARRATAGEDEALAAFAQQLAGMHLVLGHALSQRERIDDDGSRLAAQAPGSGVPVSTSPLVNCARAAVASDS
jgi:hypothetical protein